MGPLGFGLYLGRESGVAADPSLFARVDWNGEGGLCWRAREIGLEAGRGGGRASAGGLYSGACHRRRTACENFFQRGVEVTGQDA